GDRRRDCAGGRRVGIFYTVARFASGHLECAPRSARLPGATEKAAFGHPLCVRFRTHRTGGFLGGRPGSWTGFRFARCDTTGGRDPYCFSDLLVLDDPLVQNLASGSPDLATDHSLGGVDRSLSFAWEVDCRLGKDRTRYPFKHRVRRLPDPRDVLVLLCEWNFFI